VNAAHAQLNPLGSVYYQNQYLANPAMVGMDTSLNVNLSYRMQWSGIKGAPVNQSFTSDWGIVDRVGIGLMIYNDQAGLLQRTRTMASYAYHLPIAESQKLHFGISLGVMTQRVRYEDVIGDQNDTGLEQFNNRESFFDGDFGVAYTSGKLNIQAAFPNMKVILNKDENDNTVNQSTFFSAISFKMQLERFVDGMAVEPKIVYRGVNGFDNMVDVGANFSFSQERLTLMSVWHSSENMTYGVGINHNRLFSFTGMYSNNFGELRGLANGNFEMAIRLKIL
jgi:type IX secretion system PorP/SprF family membrane protein